MGEIKRYYTEEIEKSRKKIRNGDVFVVKIKGHDLYFYGKVIDTEADFEGVAKPILIYLYKTPTTEITVPDDLDINDVMTILFNNTEGWRVGHFKNVCNIPVKEEELNLDYGFESVTYGGWVTKEDIPEYEKNHVFDYLDDGRIIASAFVDAHKNKRDHIPKITNRYLLSFFPAVSYEISKYLNNNPELKVEYGLE